MRVEVENEKVEQAFEKVTREFQRQAAFPGFRPGKAPRDMVVRKYAKDIEAEVRKQLLSDYYKQAVDQQKLDVLGRPDIEEIQFTRGQPFQFAATLETAPEFELPEYRGIPLKREAREVTEEDIARALDTLRQAQTSYKTVERPAASGDVVVVSYTGQVEGKPITELAPNAKSLAEQKNFWVEIGANTFLPGFAEQLLGAKVGEHRQVMIDFPPDFVTPELAGKKGVFQSEVGEIKEKVLPALDEAFAKGFGAESLEKLREGVRRDLTNELEHKQSRSLRNQLVGSLLNRVNFELPESAVAQETRHVVYELVQENAKRGVSRDVIEKEKDQIYAAATQNAKERVKVAFLMQKIAEKEDIKISQQEVAERINHLAAVYQIPAEKFLRDLQKRNGLIEIYDQIMNEKVLAFLQQNAKIEDVPPGTPSA